MLPYVMAGLTAAKMVGDNWKEDRSRWLASQTQRYSPWTGLKAGAVDEADPIGTAMQGGTSALAMNQNMEAAAKAGELQDAQIKYLNRGAPGTGYIGMESPQKGMFGAPTGPTVSGGKGPWWGFGG